jgi:hypothetical protein
MLVEVKSNVKKSVEEREYYVNEEGRRFEAITLWRWGKFVLDLEEYELNDLRSDTEQTISVTDYNIEDQELDDDCGFSIESDDLSRDELEALYLAYDESFYEAFEKAGYFHDDTETIIFGGFTVEEIAKEDSGAGAG